MNKKIAKTPQNLLPDIEDYLETLDHGQPIIINEELESIVNAMAAKSSLNKEQAKIVLRLFLQEIRAALLRGEIISIKHWGRLFVSSPRTTGNTERVFVKYKPTKSLLNKINDK